MRRSVLWASLAIALAATGTVAAAPADAAPLRFTDCRPAIAGFACATLRVPLDHSGRVPGTLQLRVARQIRAPRGAGTLIALSGGPGQEAVAYARFTEDVLQPAASRYRLVLIDQRGTGRSGALRCPALQRLRSLDADWAPLVADCARRIGPRRQFYATTDTVADLEALRVALRAPRLALQGTSYGTYVAAQYARIHPARTERLILDSAVGPAGVDTLLADSWGPLPRILRAACAGGRCRGITADPVGDVRELAARLEARPLTGTVLDARGRPRPARLTAPGLGAMITAGDLDPHLQAALPAAIRSALDGDARPLLRLVPAAVGGPTTTQELSFALNVDTTCLDTRLSYPLTAATAERDILAAGALAAAPDAALGPFSRPLVERMSMDAMCRQWPRQPDRAPSTAPFPRVPTLVLGGSLDVRTPIENGIALAAQIPGAQMVVVPGNGHDEIDTDLNGCVRTALRRFFADRRVGKPCRASFQVPPQRAAPTTLDAVTPARGTPGRRGRVLAAAVGAVIDTRETYLGRADAGVRRRGGGGLRAGRWVLFGDNGVRLHGVAWVPGVRVTGAVRSTLGRFSGTVSVRAPGGMGGTLTFHPRRGVTGTLGGRPVRMSARAARGAVAAVLAR